MVAGLVVPRTGEVIAEHVHWARTPVERAKGLLGRAPLGAGEALIIAGARQVHTIGMRYAIDVCFCDRAWNVLHVVAPLRRHRVTRWVGGAFFAVEVRAGGLATVQPGDQLSMVELSER